MLNPTLLLIMTKIQLNLVVIRSSDIEKSVLFYQQLGLNFNRHQHGAGLEHFASEENCITFEIYPCTFETERTTTTRLGFQVDSVDAIIQELEQSGTAIISYPKDSPWGRRAIVVDPDGHKIELTQPEKIPWH
jgi:lactoylglutathione lyase